MRLHFLLPALLGSFLPMVTPAQSAPPADLAFEQKALQDLPAVSRYAGSLLLDGSAANYGELELPSSERDPWLVKGSVAWRWYVAPAGRTTVEILRNYEVALKQAGFQQRAFAMPGKAIRGSSPSRWVENVEKLAPMKRVINPNSGQPVGIPRFIDAEQTAFAGSRTLPANGTVQHVFVAVGSHTETSSNVTLADKKTLLKDLGPLRSFIFVAMVEEKGPETGMVSVFDARMVESKLQTEGRIALYALYFDTGKAELKAESKPQLDAVAQMLKANPQANVFIVGHTDMVGTLEGNLDLSRRRAQAVTAALAANYGIAASRLQAQGVGPLSPLASNAAESSRKGNRRVEIVLR
jgi:OmpA-OmpF porin, OOP family